MNIFRKKLAGANDQQLPVDPIELYQNCPYKEGYGYLRSIQEEVLKEWNTKRTQRDILCKMNTGSGKTLTGLLMLYSKLIEIKEPSLYVCPDSMLVNQTFELASQYGIPVCVFENQREFPKDFLNSKKILICNFHKLFNGKSIFNRDHVRIGSIVIDDAHKCVDIARTQSSLKLPRKHKISESLFRIFESALKFQLPGTYYRLVECDPVMLMKVPYWAWFENHEKIIEIINSYVVSADKSSSPNFDDIVLTWDLMADNLLEYECYISGDYMELTPIHVPYYEVPSFHEAKHRFILSATFEDNYDLIKDLGIHYESILEPIVPKDRKDVGKRLILAPKRFDPEINDDTLIQFLKAYPKGGVNTIVLVPSEYSSRRWIKNGAEYVNKMNINEALLRLKSSTGNFMVFDNRYDGIDLHGDLCRVLIIDGLPLYSSLQEKYTENRLEALSAGKKAQIIEQGLGRAVRSGGDYCVIYLMGSDLLNFLGYENNMQYFTPITRTQLSLGLKLLDDENSQDSIRILGETANYCLSNHPDWIKFHNSEISQVTPEALDQRKRHRLLISEIERVALMDFKQRKYQKSAELVLEKIVSKNQITDKEKSWYYQFAAQLMYFGNKATSNDLQSKACSITTNMFHPPHGHIYKKILRKGVQPALVKKYLEEFERPQDIIMHVNNILEDLQYMPEIDSKHFETKLYQLGLFLGFNSQMPDNELGNGPDVLWCMTDGHYLILEAKSRSVQSEISRTNIEQLLHSETWFNNNYGADSEYSLVTLQKSNKKGKGVSVSSKMKVLDKDCLIRLHQNVKHFANSLQTKHTKGHSEEDISKLLETYKLTPKLFQNSFLVNIK